MRFDGDSKVYNLAWAELLTVGSEIPFETYEDLTPGLKVMAPWKDQKDNLQYAEATVLTNVKSMSIFHFESLLT